MKTLFIVLVAINFIAFFILNPPSSAGQFQNLQMLGSIIPALMIACISSVILPVGIAIFRKHSNDLYTNSIIETLLSIVLMIISVTFTYFKVRYVFCCCQ